MFPDPTITVLGPDPSHRSCNINGYAFQQDAIRSFNGWQYACFYAAAQPNVAEPLHVHLGRRKLSEGDWETIRFEDYEQRTDDGHNTVQLGICPGDGTIHLSYDHHCDRLRYRVSVVGLASHPDDYTWDAKHFSSTISTLPGWEDIDDHLSYITYPRFGPLYPSPSSPAPLSSPGLWFTFRTGKAGLGDDHLCLYTPSPSSSLSSARSYAWSYVGAHLQGVQNNPYIHGLDSSPADGRLVTTWVYRGFVPYEGWDDPADTKHKSQAGPNGGENNHDICHAYSLDHGRTWRNGRGETVADLGAPPPPPSPASLRGGWGGGGEASPKEEGGREVEESGASRRLPHGIRPDADGIVAFRIPKGSGLSNQESQALDPDGGVHVLNRDAADGELGQAWKHYYYRDPRRKGTGTGTGTGAGTWTSRPLPGVNGAYGGKRGRVAVDWTRDGSLYILCPDPVEPVLIILRARPEQDYGEYEVVWKGSGFPPTEPLVDVARLQTRVGRDGEVDGDGVLSVFTRRYVNGQNKDDGIDVVVLDFQLE